MKILKIVWLVIFIGLGFLPSVYGATEAEKHFRQGYEYYSQGKYEQAIDEYQKVIEIDPNNSPTHYNLGLVYHMQGKLDDAVVAYQKQLIWTPITQGHITIWGIFITNKANLMMR